MTTNRTRQERWDDTVVAQAARAFVDHLPEGVTLDAVETACQERRSDEEAGILGPVVDRQVVDEDGSIEQLVHNVEATGDHADAVSLSYAAAIAFVRSLPADADLADVEGAIAAARS